MQIKRNRAYFLPIIVSLAIIIASLLLLARYQLLRTDLRMFQLTAVARGLAQYIDFTGMFPDSYDSLVRENVFQWVDDRRHTMRVVGRGYPIVPSYGESQEFEADSFDIAWNAPAKSAILIKVRGDWLEAHKKSESGMSALLRQFMSAKLQGEMPTP